MSQVRLSIPFIGGITKVYEGDEFRKEVNMLKDKGKQLGIAAAETAVGVGVVIALFGGFGICKGLEWVSNGATYVANSTADAHDALHHKLVKLGDKYQTVADCDGQILIGGR